MKQLVSSALIVAALVLPVAAQADAQAYTAPVGARAISGVIASIDGKFSLTVRQGGGSLAAVTLHSGTTINPTGSRLQRGTPVTIIGHAHDGTFDADTIDAPLDTGNRSTRPAGGRTPGEAPFRADIPSGTFQTNGPSAEGGG
ncbi:MAG: hypothetical protein JWN27_3303 [Candidatus Eremiobacteraeota bacterium]|nr:hypothetical protein [Candidatus Eremiobacteraeota bacterium]